MQRVKKPSGSSAHVLAQAILHFYPYAQLTTLTIEKGFYYDVDFGDESIGEEFTKIEKQMLEFARAKSEFELRPVTKAEALEVYKDNQETELIRTLKTAPSPSVTMQILPTSVVVDIHTLVISKR